MQRNKIFLSLIVVLFISSGCASSLKVLVGKERLVRIPQIVAHLEPSLERDKFLILGKIVLQNPGESDLILGKINLIIQDESGNYLSKIEADWQREFIKSREFIQAPIKFSLPLEVLNRDLIQITLATDLWYKRLAIKLPIKSKIAVIHLKTFKNSLSGPLELVVYSKLRSDILGNASIEYTLEMVNPFNMDLQMEETKLKIYTKENLDMGETNLSKTLLFSKKTTQVKGVIRLQKTFSMTIIREFIEGHEIRVQLSGSLRVPKTDILIPFKVESVQEMDFSLFEKQSK